MVVRPTRPLVPVTPEDSAVATHPYSKVNVDLAKLQAECVAAALPVERIDGGALGSPDFFVITTRDLTAPEVATLNGIVAAHDGRARRKRFLNSILADITALSGPKQTAVWNDLNSGNPAKWRTLSSDQAVWVKASQATTTLLEKQVAVAFFVRENVKYLVNPAFDPSINIPGDEPIV